MMRHPRWRHFGRLLVSRRRPSALRRLQLSSTTDRFIIPKEDAASGARWRRQMNERVRRRNAWVVGRNDLAHCPWPDTCPTSMYVGGSEKGVQTATPRSQLVESDRTRSNLGGQIWRRFRCDTPAATRTRLSGGHQQDVTGHQRRRVRAKRSTRVRGGISNQTPAAHRLLRMVARHALGHAIGVESGKEE